MKKAITQAGGSLLITSDHGNGDKMLDLETGEMYTEHTANPVPFILVDAKHKKRQLKNSGKLGDIAPTILKLMKIKKPKEMTGKSLL